MGKAGGKLLGWERGRHFLDPHMISLSHGADLRSFGVRFHSGTAQPGVPFVPFLPPSTGHSHSLKAKP